MTLKDPEENKDECRINLDPFCDREDADRRLKLSDQILQRVGALVIAADVNGAVTFVGPSSRDILGYEPAELVGEGWWTAVYTEQETGLHHRERFAEMARGVLPAKKAPYEQQVRHRNGSIRWILWHDTVTPERQAISVGQDITDRKRAEEQLVKIIRAVEQSPVSVIITDLNGNIEYVNPNLTAVTGYAREELIGESQKMLESGEMTPERYRHLWDTIQGGHEWTGELHTRNKTGDLIWQHATISPIKNSQGEITHFMAIMEDITARKSLERQLYQAQKMEALGTLAGGIAHDFNNLLTAINGYSDLILANLNSDSPIRREVAEIKKAGERAANLTRQLLAYGRKQVLRPLIVNLNDILSDIDELIRGLIRDNIELITCLQPNLGRVLADPGQIEQVIINIVINARDAMPDGGKLILLTADVQVDPGDVELHPGLSPGGYVLLTLSDTGVGMDAETLPHIFEPFFTTKEVGKGSGLGLSTAYGIIKQSGGYIHATSTPGAGATFEIYLPRAENPGKP